MDRLPDELLDRIFSLLEGDELWAIVQVSSAFRRIAILPCLSRYGISSSDIQNGTVSLSAPFFLILVVSHMRPIQRLTCFTDRVSRRRGTSYRTLVSILCLIPPIPDIKIYNRQYVLQRTGREAAHLLSRIPHYAASSLFIIKGNSTHLSRPRSGPTIRWKLLPPPFSSSTLSTSTKIVIFVFGLPLLFAYLVSGIVNCGVVLIWAYRRWLGPEWPQEERIVEDAGLLVFDDWMRIQVLPGNFTLVTLTKKQSPELTIGPVHGVGDNIYSSILAALDLGTSLTHLRVDARSNLIHTELMQFLRRHPTLMSLFIEPDSIRPSTLMAVPMPKASTGNLFMLTAPAPYIPHLLPITPSVTRICIPFLPAAGKRTLHIFQQTAFDTSAYCQALEAIATLPGFHPLTLSLSFRLTATSLPWMKIPDAEALSADNAPETRLSRVHDIELWPDGSMRFGPAVIRRLARWLGLFPGLQRVRFPYGSVEKIPRAKRSELAEIICTACQGINTPQDIAFNVADG
ncbi:hypothetical protein C8J57DRAFT_1326490 [Mycena rebaudengoi]|nr:hypothetical protein C8J57DRAFT_1326490 [Mycena rebaudengoi]